MIDDIVTRLRKHVLEGIWDITECACDIQDGIDEIERLRAENDQWKDVCYSLARYHIEDSDKTVFEVIEDEKRWISQQAQWSETGDIQ